MMMMGGRVVAVGNVRKFDLRIENRLLDAIKCDFGSKGDPGSLQ